jgi:hypothetical protein
MGTNHSSDAERGMCNKFDACYYHLYKYSFILYYQVIFVCMTLIGVKSKYGSCSGNCTGLIKINSEA